MEKVKPHWGWFLAGPAVLLLGGVGAVVLMAAGIMSTGADMQHVKVPGEAVVHIDEPGEKILFIEQTGVANASAPPGMMVSITPPDSEVPLTVENSGASFTYNNGSVAGRNFGKVNFPAAGDYRVKVSVPEGVPASGQVAVGGNPAGKIIGTIFGFFGLGFGSFVLCIIIVVVVALKRSRSRKRIMQQRYAGHPGMPPSPPPGAMAQ
jgi:hypothetical protein